MIGELLKDCLTLNKHLDLIQIFPRLYFSGFNITSEKSTFYNCIAWAAGLTDRSWWPGLASYYWPPQCSQENTVASFLAAFELLGYKETETISVELDAGYEKVALYVNNAGIPTHMARQLPNGEWTSKLGQLEDISHNELDALEGTLYGRICCTLARPIRD